MKIFSLETYNAETLYRFIDFSNACWEDEWCIYLESVGGSRWIAAQIDEILNRKVFTETSCYLNVAMAYSSAFSTMMSFKGKINILYTARGMYHQTSFSKNLNLKENETSANMNNYDISSKKSNKQDLKKEISFCKTFMTEQELQDFEDGKDIYYNEKQLLTFVKQKK